MWGTRSPWQPLVLPPRLSPQRQAGPRLPWCPRGTHGVATCPRPRRRARPFSESRLALKEAMLPRAEIRTRVRFWRLFPFPLASLSLLSRLFTCRLEVVQGGGPEADRRPLALGFPARKRRSADATNPVDLNGELLSPLETGARSGDMRGGRSLGWGVTVSKG